MSAKVVPTDGRTRLGQVERIQRAALEAVRRILGRGGEATVQVVVVDLTTHEAIQVSPLPRRPAKGKRLHRERESVAQHNWDVIFRQSRETLAAARAIEEAAAAAADRAAGPG